MLDIASVYKLSFDKKGGKSSAGLLHEVPDQERNQESQEHHDEKRQTGDAGCMPSLRHEII